MWAVCPTRIRFSRGLGFVASSLLWLALTACDITPAHMTCYDAAGDLVCYCHPIYADCDKDLLNGCETNTATDNDHCGACGKACLSPQVCLNGVCGCNAANCFCADFATDPKNCGACGISVDDGNACTDDSCVAALPVHTNRPAGTSCWGGDCNSNGVCLPQNGASCSSNDGCASGFCVDGVCCENACDGPCESCTKAETGAWEGVCRPILYFTDPADECPNGVCDGFGQCTNPGVTCANALDCASGFCVDGFCCDSPCADACMACNVVGNVGSCVPVPMFEDDANAIPPCTGSTSSCNGSGVCKEEGGQTCATNAECLSGNCEMGFCGESVLQTGPLVWEWHQDASLGPVDVWYTYQYPSMTVSSMVASNSGNVVVTGTYGLSVFGMPSGTYYRHLGNQVGDEYDYRGPHPFILNIDSLGQLQSNRPHFQSMGQVGWSRTYQNTWGGPYNCGGWCPIRGEFVVGPYLWLAGGDVGTYRESWDYGPAPYPLGPNIFSCKFGELTQLAPPLWTLGTSDVCAMRAWNITGDDAGNTWIRNNVGLTKYDLTGQSVQTLPDPFPGISGELTVGPQGELYIGERTASDIRLAKANAAGTLQWSKTVPTPLSFGSNTCFSYAVDTARSILLAFHSVTTADLGNGPMPPLGPKDLVLAKLDPQGNVTWAKRFGGLGFEVKSCSLRRTGNNDFAVALDYAGKVDLGDGMLDAPAVLVKFDALGLPVWHADLSAHFPFVAEDQSWALAGHPSGLVFVSGAGHAPDPPNWWQPRLLRFVVAKYGP